PEFTGNLTITENLGYGTLLGYLQSRDADGDSIIWRVDPGTGFSIDDLGRLYVEDPSKFDYEAYADHKISATVTASDGRSGSQATITFDLTDVAENPTDVRIINGTSPVENAYNIRVGELTGTDQERYGALSFEVMNPSSGFSAQWDNGKIFLVANNVNYEAWPGGVADVVVRATNQVGHYSDTVLRVYITDAPEAPKGLKINNGAGVSVNENVSNVSLGTLLGVDDDAGSTFTYALENTAFNINNPAFEIVGDQLRLKTALNYEAINPFQQVTIRVTDNTGRSSIFGIGVQIRDVNEAPDTLTYANPHAIRAWETDPGSQVIKFNWTDPDTVSSFRNNVFSFTNGTRVDDSGMFMIDAFGQVTTRSQFTAPGTYVLHVQVEDESNPALKKTIDYVVVVDEMVNSLPSLTVATGDERTYAVDTGDPVSPFRGVRLYDLDNDDLTFTLSFEKSDGDLAGYGSAQSSFNPNTGIITYTFTGKGLNLQNLVRALTFNPTNGYANTTEFTLAVKDRYHDWVVN
ncbi:cadherin repeat domain-containing protein, partial [Vibrio parahaemolyticus]|nr:cadherin repeat domain-containing protein [Vibrio parahaemolyticus]